MNTAKIVTLICWIVTVLVLIGLILWFVTGSIFGFRSTSWNYNGWRDWGINSNMSGNIFETLTGAYEVRGSYGVDATHIDSIDIDWIAGDVNIKPYEGANIQITEYAQRELRENEKVRFRVDGSSLKIDYREREIVLVMNMPPKRLEVLIPQTLAENLKELSIEAVSADIGIDGINAGKLDCETTSGSVNAAGKYDKIDMESVSGRINLRNTAINSEAKAETISGSIELNGTFEDADISSVSGSVSIASRVVPSSMKINTISGSVTLALPADAAVSVNHSSVSGKLTSNDIPLMMSGSNAAIKIETVSGSTRIVVYEG